jgi:hypothetical protein
MVAYGDIALRTFHDLDILVQWQDYFEPKRLLIEQGYHDTGTSYFLNEDHQILAHQSFGEYPLEQSHRRTSLDVHGRLLSIGSFPIPSNFSQFWQRLQPISFLDQTVLTFRVEDLLLYLCVNGTRDCWKYFRSICDIAELVHRHPNINWEDLLAQSTSLKIRRMTLLGLYLAHHILDLVLPPEIAQVIEADPKVKQLATPVVHCILNNEDNPNAIGLKKLSFHLIAVEHLSSQMLFCLGLLMRAFQLYLRPNLRDRSFIALPRPLYFLYVVLRPIRLIRDHGFSLFNLVVS